jgi:hypothetical protein
MTVTLARVPVSRLRNAQPQRLRFYWHFCTPYPAIGARRTGISLRVSLSWVPHGPDCEDNTPAS